MKNYFSKSTSEFDFQKFFNLILTEQRAQRVDLARLSKTLTDLLDTQIPQNETSQREEVPDDFSGSTGE